VCRIVGLGKRAKFSSQILPPYLRKTKSVEELITWLYLKGISTGDFNEALAALLGPDAKGLSATTVTRLKGIWQEEYQQWSRRSLADQRYVYVWADGIHFNIRLEHDRQCILVLMGATPDGAKEVIAISEGYRSELALARPSEPRPGAEPELATATRPVVKALPKVWPRRGQRCWVHKTANVLDKLPKGQQPKAKEMLHAIWMAASRTEANQAFDLFLGTWKTKYPKATDCLAKDREALLAFYDFPAEHWLHIRTTNPIESVLATVRLRTCKTKGCGSRVACETMVFKLMESAAKGWRKLNGSLLLPEVIRGVKFVDGEKLTENAA
jgi:transposase-like protein